MSFDTKLFEHILQYLSSYRPLIHILKLSLVSSNALFSLVSGSKQGENDYTSSMIISNYEVEACLLILHETSF